MNDPIIDAKDIAKDLKISRAHAHKLITGDVLGCEPIPHLALGRRKVVRLSSYEAWKSRIEKGGIIAPAKELAAASA